MHDTEQLDPTLALLVSQGFSHTIIDRFWAKVRKTDGCWLWTGATLNSGYGKINVAGSTGATELAHRLSWLIHRGLVPEDESVLHDCPNQINRLCVNPDHLFTGRGHKDKSKCKPIDKQPEIERFAERVILNRETGCWEWNGKLSRKGYSKFWTEYSAEGHVFSFKFFIGPIPDGMEIHHKCRVRHCVNPYHLEPKTHQDNCLTDFRKAVCSNGHEFVAGSFYEYRKGSKTHRQCRICAIARAKAHYEAKKLASP